MWTSLRLSLNIPVARSHPCLAWKVLPTSPWGWTLDSMRHPYPQKGAALPLLQTPLYALPLDPRSCHLSSQAETMEASHHALVITTVPDSHNDWCTRALGRNIF